MAVEGEVLARDFLKLEARKQQIEALQWKSVEEMRCRQNVEETQRAANVGELDRRIEEGERERQRTLERNQLISEQAHLYQRQAQVRLPSRDRGGGRSEAVEKLRDSRELYAGQVERMAGQWHQVVEDQMKEEIKVAKSDAMQCQQRQTETLEAACRQEQLLQELCIERRRMQEERSKLHKLDKEVADRHRSLRERLEAEMEVTDQTKRAVTDRSTLDLASTSTATPVAENARVQSTPTTQGQSRAIVHQGAPGATLQAQPSATLDHSSIDAGTRPNASSNGSMSGKSALFRDLAAKGKYVPRKGTRQYEVYQRLTNYEMEMQSDLNLLEAAPLPVLLRDVPGPSRSRSNPFKINFDREPRAPVVYIPPPISSQLHSQGRSSEPLADLKAWAKGRPPQRQTIGSEEHARQCVVQDSAGSRSASPHVQRSFRYREDVSDLHQSTDRPVLPRSLRNGEAVSRLDLSMAEAAPDVGTTNFHSTVLDNPIRAPLSLDGLLSESHQCCFDSTQGVSLASEPLGASLHTYVSIERDDRNASALAQGATHSPLPAVLPSTQSGSAAHSGTARNTPVGGDFPGEQCTSPAAQGGTSRSTPLAASFPVERSIPTVPVEMLNAAPSAGVIDDQPLHMQVGAPMPNSPTHSLECSGDLHMSSSGGELNMDAWIPLSARGGDRSSAVHQPKLDEAHMNASLQESLSFSPGQTPAGLQSHLGIAQALSGGLRYESSQPSARDALDGSGQSPLFLQSGGENSLADGKRRPSDTLSLSASAANNAVDGSFGRLPDCEATKASALLDADTSAMGSFGVAVLPASLMHDPSETSKPSSRLASPRPMPGPGQEHDTRSAGWGNAPAHSGPGTPTSLHSGGGMTARESIAAMMAAESSKRGTPVQPAFEARPFGRPALATPSESSAKGDMSFEARPFGRPASTGADGVDPSCEARHSGRLAGAAEHSDTSFETRPFGRPAGAAATGADTSLETRPFGRPVGAAEKAIDSSFESRPFGRPAGAAETGADTSFETRPFGRPTAAVDNGVDTSFETRPFGRPALDPVVDKSGSTSFESRDFGKPVGDQAPPKVAPKTSVAPWSGDGRLVAALGVSELEEDEVQGSDEEPLEDVLRRPINAGRIGNTSRQTALPAAKEISDAIAKTSLGDGYRPSIGQSTNGRPVNKGIQPSLNSFDLGAELDGLSESEDILKASMDQAPSEAGSGSNCTPTRRKNPLGGRSVTGTGMQGRNAGLRAGMLGGSASEALRKSSDASEASSNNSIGGKAAGKAASTGRPLFGSAGGSDYVPSSSKNTPSPTSFRPKAKANSKFSLSSALGGDIDWSQANDPKW